MKKISFLVTIISILLCLQNCNKVKNKTKDKMHIPDYSYKDNNIDQFYYTSKTIGSNQIIPLIKPYNISNIGSPSEWFLDTDFGFFFNELGGGFLQFHVLIALKIIFLVISLLISMRRIVVSIYLKNGLL